MPPQDRVGRHDRRDLAEDLAPECLSENGKPATLVCAKPQASPLELATQRAVLLNEVFDHAHLVAMDHAGNNEQQQAERRQIGHGGFIAAVFAGGNPEVLLPSASPVARPPMQVHHGDDLDLVEAESVDETEREPPQTDPPSAVNTCRPAQRRFEGTRHSAIERSQERPGSSGASFSIPRVHRNRLFDGLRMEDDDHVPEPAIRRRASVQATVFA